MVLKYGVCSANVDTNGCVIPGKSLRIYGYGQVTDKVLENKIIPIIEERRIAYPIVIYSYYSEYQRAQSKTGIHIIMDGRGIRFQPRELKRTTKTYDLFIDKNKEIHSIEEREDCLRIVPKHNKRLC